MSKYVIIGNSAGAIGCVEGIRAYDKENEITIISDEEYHTYSRPLISYLLEGKTDLNRMKYRGDNFYKDNNCTVMLGKKVVKISKDDKKVVLASGEEIPYEKLLVATGSTPFVPPMAGLENVQNKFTFAKLSDALALQEAVNLDSKVLIIGAGLIGLKCAECLDKKVKSITIVDLAPKVLSSILDDTSAEMIKEHLEKNNMNVILGDSVKQFTSDNATLNSGKEIPFDVLVLAVGVRANTSLVKEIGGNVGRGITVNSQSQTSISDIYSAGDCTETVDFSSGDVKVMALLPNAYMQGETAGKNMAGHTSYFLNAIPMNSLGVLGLHMVTAGSYTGETYESNENGNYKKLFYSNNKLNGYIIVGDINNAGIYTSLIRNKTKLDSIDFNLICERPTLMAFTREDRKYLLGGAQ